MVRITAPATPDSIQSEMLILQRRATPELVLAALLPLLEGLGAFAVLSDDALELKRGKVMRHQAK